MTEIVEILIDIGTSKKSRSNSPIYRKVVRMYHAQGGRCGYCGTPDMYLRKEVTKGYHQSHRHLMATFDHVVARSNGGTYAYENGVCACSRCNTLKADLPIEEFFEQYDELYERLIKKPQRIAAKRKRNFLKNGFIIARYAERIGKTVEELFLEYVYNTRAEMEAA